MRWEPRQEEVLVREGGWEEEDDSSSDFGLF